MRRLPASLADRARADGRLRADVADACCPGCRTCCGAGVLMCCEGAQMCPDCCGRGVGLDAGREGPPRPCAYQACITWKASGD